MSEEQPDQRDITIQQLVARVNQLEQDIAVKRTSMHVANSVLSKLGVHTWDENLEYTDPVTEEAKNSIVELIAFGKSVLELEKQIQENPTAMHYWTRMLTFLKLGDDNGTFAGIKGARKENDDDDQQH